MALIKLLTITLSFVVTAKAGYVWKDDNDWPRFQPIRMPNYLPLTYFPPLPLPPPLPQIPGFLPLSYPPLPNFNINFPPLPKIPTPGEIVDIQPEPGQIYNGVAVKSSSGFVRDKDGKLVKKGGTVVVTNDNGDVKEFKVGESPPNIRDPIVVPPIPPIPSMPQFHFAQFPVQPIFQPIQFEPIHEFEPLKFEPIVPMNPDDIRNYQPNDDENFISVSTSSFSHASDIDGVKSSGGGANTLVNNNGKVDEDAVRFGKHDKPK